VHRSDRWLALLAAALIIGGCSPKPTPTPTTLQPQSPGPAGSAGPATSAGITPISSGSPSAAAGLLLSEVAFTPVPPESPFVEISNVGSSPIDLGGASLRVDSRDLPLGGEGSVLAPGGQLVVRFDGLGTGTGEATQHAPAGFTLSPAGGSLELLDQHGQRLDRVAWGATQPDGVKLSAGALVADRVPPGTVIGRLPGATQAGQPLAWAEYAPGEASPGRPNSMASVGVLLPPSGAVVDGAHAMLAWYPVAGAAGYRIQLASDAGFATILSDTTVTGPQFDTGPLAPGDYAWRVAALAADGSASSFSEPSTISLAAPVAAAIVAVARPSTALFASDALGRQLSVPLLSQHKDTSMLLIEDPQEHGTHAWDNDHRTFDPSDPADNQNCAIASIAMVNHFFGGDLSQDRIGYEIYAELLRPGSPERDLNYGYGIYADHVTKALTFALGAAPTHLEPGMSADEIWSAVTASIDAGRPVIAAGTSHVFVYTGYRVRDGKRLVSTNDPWNYAGGPSGAGQLNIDAASGKNAPELMDLWLLPANAVGRRQEASVTANTDSDDVVDFDETMRFHTDPGNPDTDADKVRDKQDIASGLFDAPYGYALHPAPDSAGRDFDVDGIPTELDPDSDAGGCQDGQEDQNADGHRNGKETSNFDASDDACHDLFGTITFDRTSSRDTGVGSVSRETGQETLHVTVQVVMQTDPNDPTGLIDAGSSFTVSRTETAERQVPDDCNPARTISRSSGTYRFLDPPVPSPGHTAGELGGDGGPKIWGQVDRGRGLMMISMVAWYPETLEKTCQLFDLLPSLPDVIDDWACGDKFLGFAGLGLDATIADQPAGPFLVLVDCTSEGSAFGWAKQKIVASGQLTYIAR
jgi:Lamin Tail Domain/Peptidase_C39 like family